MPIRQADAPNQCSSANKSVYELLRHWHSSIALRVLRSLSHCLQLIRHSSRQLPVSFMPLHSFRPSFRFITPRSQLCYLLQGMASRPTHKNKAQRQCTCLFANPPYNTHWVPFRFTTSSIHFSRIQSTRCPQFGVPCVPATAAGWSWFLNPGTRLDANQKTTPNPCILSSCLPPFHGSVATTVAGARSHFRSFLPPVASYRHASAANASRRTSVPPGYASFGRRRYYLLPTHNDNFHLSSKTKIMCKVSDKLKLCTCNAEEISLADSYWVLKRYNPDNQVTIMGEVIMPYTLEKSIDDYNVATLLSSLNTGNCFDIPMSLHDKDILELHLILPRNAIGSFINYTFIYSKGHWEHTEYNPFIHPYDEWQEGCIKDPF